jgi:hypothetical protein
MDNPCGVHVGEYRHGSTYYFGPPPDPGFAGCPGDKRQLFSLILCVAASSTKFYPFLHLSSSWLASVRVHIFLRGPIHIS